MLDQPSAHEPSDSLLSDYYSRRQLAELLGISIRSLQLWETKRIGPPITIIARHAFYRKAAVRQWLANQERPTVRRIGRARSAP